MMNITNQITFESCNLNTIMNFSQLEKNSRIMPHPGLIVLYIVSLIMLETLGNLLLFCMIWYEKYGMDSKKRTISNQLMSRMIMVLILFNIIMMPIILLGLIFGPVSKYFIWIQAIYRLIGNIEQTEQIDLGSNMYFSRLLKIRQSHNGLFQQTILPKNKQRNSVFFC